jgi:cathepsin A (carboxypeptidase C)
MKLSNISLAALSTVAAVASADAGDQFKFEIPHKTSLVHKTVTELLGKLAQEFGQALDDIPVQAIDAWAEVITSFPKSVGELTLETSQQLAKKLTSKAKDTTAKFTTPSSGQDWLYVVENAKLPEHSLRVKTPEKLGVDTVKQYSGYLDVKDEDKHFFYWFFESRNDPETDPVVLWLNGGPGCSSLTGLFFELGPSSIGKDIKPIYNPYAWNSNASVIFLDQPVNTGYSYSSQTVSDTVTAGKDVYAFLSLFFQQFPEYSDLDFHISGESYAGHYIPVFADEILSHDDRNFELTSLLIGNGLTDPLSQYDMYEPMACGGGGYPAVLSEDECQGMLDAQPRCNSLIEACYNSESVWTCVPASIYCNNVMMGPYQKTGLNVYDIRTPCGESALCYDDLQFVVDYLNKPEVKKALGAQVDTYTECNFDTNRNFLFAGDWMKPYYHSVVNVLESGIPVLIYAGDKDFICNWLGNEAWTKNLEWSGAGKFKKADTLPWSLNGEEVGEVTNAGDFTFLRIYDAGHMAPYNQPEASLDMLNRWIGGDRSFQ